LFSYIPALSYKNTKLWQASLIPAGYDYAIDDFLVLVALVPAIVFHVKSK
jgi:hypothetical protein